MEVKSGHDVKFTYVSCNRDKKVKQFDVGSGKIVTVKEVGTNCYVKFY